MRGLREGIQVAGEVQPRAAGEMEVTAPLAGRLVSVRAMQVGATVSEGQVLASVLPPTSVPADLASIEQLRAEAAAALDFARKDRQRAERLVAAGASPERRLEEARTVEAAAGARHQSAITRLAQYESSTAGQAESPGAKPFVLRAPISGLLAEAHAAPGRNVAAGELVYRIADLDRVQVAALVPESEMARIGSLSGAELEIPGREGRLPLGRPSWVGRLIDPATRTFPVLFPFENRGAALRQTVTVWLYLGGKTPRPAVPEAAIVEDNGQPVVYVQREGERFERRVVRLGAREGGWVEIADGVRAGERAVTKGAFLVRLASLSSTISGHGHVH
jgi:RND family efflux transporter MFP subunit